ncbi:MAG: SRPBCC domain-containing protein [Ignavibacteriaceae bacterium]|nr:SRPBCC domain-containing protein [Ignavibacteriaceae bacterium]
MIKKIALILIIFSFSNIWSQNAESQEKIIKLEIDVPASITEVWNAWTTEDGIKSFFAPDCKVEAKPGGYFEIYILPDAEYGQKGSEGCRVLAAIPFEYFSFTWTAPPSIPSIRGQFNQVVLKFSILSTNLTKVELTHYGWGESEDWVKMYNYFKKAWEGYVLPNLKKRFETGPVNWEEIYGK